MVLSFSLYSCNVQNKNTMPDDKYQNLDKFQYVINHYHDSLENKYSIKEFAFDVECIYGKEDLTNLVKEMLALGGFHAEEVYDKSDLRNSSYITNIKIKGRNYEFKTSSKGDYVDLETVYPSLQQIAKDLNPDFEYNFSNRDGGQVAYMIFAKSSDLIKAVDEGYPCSLESGKWMWDGEWEDGLYSDIEVEKIPNFDDLKEKYHRVLQELYSKGYNVPNLTIQRIYIDDIFKKNIIDIIIDGGPMITSFNDIIGNKVRCFWDGWGVTLAYILLKYYDGKPTLFSREEKSMTPITVNEYLNKAEIAFGKRK